MLRLTLLLCATMFVTALIGGRDYGQMRPGLKAAHDAALLAQAQPQAKPAPRAVPQAAPVVAASVQPAAAPVAAPLQMPLVQAQAQAAAAAPAAAEPATAVWFVKASSVNVRLGPSTDTEVLGRLDRGEAATVISVSADGWAQIRIEGDGIEGYVAARYLTPDAAAD